MESKGGMEVSLAEYGMPTRFARCGGRNDGFTSIALPFTVLPPVAHPHKGSSRNPKRFHWSDTVLPANLHLW